MTLFRPRAAAMVTPILFFMLQRLGFAASFASIGNSNGLIPPTSLRTRSFAATARMSLAPGEFTVEMTKPLGIILEEREAGGEGGGVRVASLVEGGNAEQNGNVVPGDVLLCVGSTDVSTFGFDEAMDVLIGAPDDRPLTLALSDGLGRMDIAKNLARQISNDDAVFADAVVREAVRTARRLGSQNLGFLVSVEIVIGAGVRDGGNTCAVQFFAIFSTGTAFSSYSCNVSAVGKRRPGVDGGIEIVALSAAKGLGQTVDLIQEDESWR